MKLISYKVNNQPSFGILTQDGVIDLKSKLQNSYFDLKTFIEQENFLDIALKFLDESADYLESEIEFLPVIPNPNKIICVGMNYKDKRIEFAETCEAPTLFIRFADSQTGHNCEIIKPELSNEFDYEGELALIIGKTCRNIKKEQAFDYLAGYSCYMDASARDWQYAWFTAGKNWPKTGGFGPCLLTKDEVSDPKELQLVTLLNQKEMQNDCIANLVHDIGSIIEYISAFTELTPGDVILTGSPGGVGKKRNPPVFMYKGDIVEVQISKIGKLKNYIV